MSFWTLTFAIALGLFIGRFSLALFGSILEAIGDFLQRHGL